MFDADNKQMVGVRGNDIVILRPYPVMTKSEALVHAAWLVTLADEFQKVLRAVHNG
jgi:hypothetical protein